MQDKNIPKEAHIFKWPPYHEEGNMQERAVMMIISTGDHIGIRDALKEGGIQVRVEDHLVKEDIPIRMEGLLEEEDILEEDPLDGGGAPNGDGEPPDGGAPLEIEDLRDLQWTRTTRPSRTP